MIETQFAFENIAICMVIYNPTLEVFETIKSYSMFSNIFIFDNSKESNKKDIDSFKINCTYFFDSTNIGYTKALNVLFKYAYEKKIPYCMPVDQESNFVYENFINYFCYFVDTPKIGVLSPFFLIDRKKRKPKRNTFTKSKWVMFNDSLIRTNLLHDINYLDERFFIDWSDYDFCLSISKKEYISGTYNKYIVKAHPGITRKTRIMKIKYGYCSPIRIYYQFRDGLLCYSKHRYKKIYLILLIKFIKILILFDKKNQFLNMVLEGIKDYKTGDFGKRKL